MPRKNILITGATGFIGTHLVKKLLHNNQYQIIAIIRKCANNRPINELYKEVNLIEGSFYDPDLLDRIFDSFPISYVIHLAALRGAGKATKNEYHKINVLGTETLLRVSLKHQINKFIFCSSVGVFGTIPDELPAHLHTALNEDNDYHQSKILAESKVSEYIKRGLNAFIVRPAITYGSGDTGFPATLIQLVRKRMLLLPRKNTTIHLLDVHSLTGLFLSILKTDDPPGKIYIAADRTPISLKKLVDLIYYHCHNKNYPSLMTAPDSFFTFLSFIFRSTGNKKWLTRILLLSQSWYYDISQTITTLHWNPPETNDSFIKNLDI